jgi:putative salt-induced outer membrane protein YdiY
MKRYLIGMVLMALALSATAAEKTSTTAPKADAEAVAPAPVFKTALNAGLTLTDGNSETLAVNIGLVTEGEKEGLGSVLAGMEANYGESTVSSSVTDETTGETTVSEVKETTVENAKAYANVKKTLSPRTFAALDGSVLYDDVALIDYRALLGPGLGVYLIKNDRRTLTLEAGPSYVWEKLDGITDDYLALRFAQRYTCQATANAKLVQALEYVPEAEDFDNYLLNFELGVEAAMSDRLSLRVVLQNKYDNTPAEGAERNDLSVIAGIGLAL